jgi:hypothetical protein
MISLLLTSGADIGAKEKRGLTPREYAASFRQEQAVSFLREAEDQPLPTLRG